MAILRAPGTRSESAAIRLLLAWGSFRLVYLIWLSPWNLLGDEAYYWVQSQHLALSYAEKGPLLAWILAGFGALFGRSEWAVRLPVMLASLAAGWGVWRLTLSKTRRDPSAGFVAVLIFILTPAMIANAQICTQDGLVVPWFVALAAIGLRVVRRWEAAEPNWKEWAGFYSLLGVGMLLKQSMPLFLTSIAVFAIVRRRYLKITPALVAQQLIGLLIVVFACTPILIWDSRQGWPLLHHTLGHLGFGHDEVATRKHGNAFLWIANTLVSLAGAAGPALILMIWASIRAWRERAADDAVWRDRLWLMCTAWPSIGFYVLLSLTKPVVPSWPLPSLVTLIPLAGAFAASELRRVHRRKSFEITWKGLIIYGCGALLLLSFPTILGHLPIVGATLNRKVLSRLDDGPELAERARSAAMSRPNVAMVVAPHYQHASLLAFYMPNGPTITCAGSYVADRLSNFDTWPETSLADPARVGTNMLLVGGTLDGWQHGIEFESIEPLNDGMFFAVNFRGVRTERADRRQKGSQ